MATEYIESEIHAQGEITGGIEYRPKTFLQHIKYMLIIFLHGIGERGDGSDLKLDKLRTHGTVSGLEAAVRNAGNVILMEPQTSSNWQYNEVDEIYDIAFQRYGQYLDKNACYLTGLSLGGGGTCRYMARNPKQKRFAAYAPMCPGGNQFFITNADGYKNIAEQDRPGWFFHAVDDEAVAPEESTSLTIDKCKAINPQAPLIQTLWKSGGHTGGWKTYNRYGQGVPACTPAEALEFNNPACNLLQWFEMNRLDKPAVMPPQITSMPPVIIPEIPTALMVQGINFYGEDVKIQKVYKGKPAVNITAAHGDRGVNIWIPELMPLRATIDYFKAPNLPVAPEPDLTGYNVYGYNVKAQILYRNSSIKETVEAPKGERCVNVWIPAISPIRGTMKIVGEKDGKPTSRTLMIGKV